MRSSPAWSPWSRPTTPKPSPPAAWTTLWLTWGTASSQAMSKQGVIQYALPLGRGGPAHALGPAPGHAPCHPWGETHGPINSGLRSNSVGSVLLKYFSVVDNVTGLEMWERKSFVWVAFRSSIFLRASQTDGCCWHWYLLNQRMIAVNFKNYNEIVYCISLEWVYISYKWCIKMQVSYGISGHLDIINMLMGLSKDAV